MHNFSLKKPLIRALFSCLPTFVLPLIEAQSVDDTQKILLNYDKEKILQLLEQAKIAGLKGDIALAERLYFEALALNPNVIEGQFGAPLAPFTFKPLLPREKLWKKEESLQNKSLLVIGIKGNGDTLQFSRFIPLLEKTGLKEVFFMPQKGLKRLFEHSIIVRGKIKVTVLDPENFSLLQYDKYIPLLSLPDYLGVEVSQISAKAYLSLPKKEDDYLDNMRYFKIGIVYTGDKNHIHNHDRTFSVEELVPLTKIPNVQLFSLQLEDKGKALTLSNGKVIPNLIESGMKDYYDTALLLNSLDLLISADTSLCHLGGAMGKTTFVPLSKKTDLRFIGTGQSTFWYDSMKLFRQKSLGRWKEPFEEIVESVRQLVKAKGIG